MFFEIGDVAIDRSHLFIAVLRHLFVTQFSNIFLQNIEPTANLSKQLRFVSIVIVRRVNLRVVF